MRRLFTYGLIGGGVSLLYAGLVVLLVERLHVGAVAASVLAFCVTMPISYLGHSRFTFADRDRSLAGKLKFASATAVAFCAAPALMYAVTHWTHWPYLVGIGLIWVVIPLANYMVFFVWVFAAGKEDPAIP